MAIRVIARSMGEGLGLGLRQAKRIGGFGPPPVDLLPFASRDVARLVCENGIYLAQV